MIPLERLRLATALCHSVPDAQLRLCTDRGQSIVVAHHPAADIDPCAMRRVVAASARRDHPDRPDRPDRPDLSARIVDIEIIGALADLGGGVSGSRSIDGEQRWLASLLPADRVAAIVDEASSRVGSR